MGAHGERTASAWVHVGGGEAAWRGGCSVLELLVSLVLGRWRQLRWLEVRAAVHAAVLLGWRRCCAALVLLVVPLVRATRAASNALGFPPRA